MWIAFCLEALIYWGAYKSNTWKDVFNWTMTYRTDSEVFNPYRMLKYKPSLPDTNYTTIAMKKSKDVAWFVSNCSPTSQRINTRPNSANTSTSTSLAGVATTNVPRRM